MTPRELGESPVWIAAARQLYWVDIYGGILHRLDAATGVRHQWSIGAPLPFAVAASDGTLVLGRGLDLLSFDPATGDCKKLLQIADPAPHVRCNDAKCDVRRRLWVGTLSERKEEFAGSLYRIGSDLQCDEVLSDLGVPNGPCWSPTNDSFYLADSRRGVITRYDFDIEAGTIKGPALFATSDPPAKPDGAAVDANGTVWSCQWDGACIKGYRPDGSLAAQIDISVARPTSCAFGGASLRTLYVTTANAGTVLTIPMDVPGIPVGAFICRPASPE